MKDERATITDSVRRLRNECSLVSGVWHRETLEHERTTHDIIHALVCIKEFRLDLFHTPKNHSLFMSQFVIMWWICTYKGTANEKRSEESAFGGCIFQDKDEEFFSSEWRFMVSEIIKKVHSAQSRRQLKKLAMEISYNLVRFLCKCIVRWNFRKCA